MRSYERENCLHAGPDVGPGLGRRRGYLIQRALNRLAHHGKAVAVLFRKWTLIGFVSPPTSFLPLVTASVTKVQGKP